MRRILKYYNPSVYENKNLLDFH